MTYGYARVSTVEQNEARQLIALKADGALEFLLARNPSYYHAEQEPER